MFPCLQLIQRVSDNCCACVYSPDVVLLGPARRDAAATNDVNIINGIVQRMRNRYATRAAGNYTAIIILRILYARVIYV